MRLPVNVVAAAATAAAFVTAAVLPARAECKRYGFEVNDYGKDGPTKDAKSLLDKMIATKMAEKGVKDYHTGKKSVSCEMFLNFVVFDEYTCAAEATVCWGGSQLPASEQAKAGDSAEPAETASKSDTKEQSKEASKESSKEASKDSSTSTEEAPAKAVKVSSKTAKAAKKTSMKSIDPEASEKKSVALRVPDPKPQRLQKIEVKSEETSGGDSASAPAAVTTEPAAAPASTPAADVPSAPDSASSQKPTTADSTKPGASKPVETGSLAEPAKKTVEHKAEKSASDVAPVKHTASDAGYPTPLPPQPQDTPAP